MDATVLLVVIAALLGVVIGWFLGARGAAAARSTAEQAQRALESASQSTEARIRALEEQATLARGAEESARKRADELQEQLAARTRVVDLLTPVKEAVDKLQSDTREAETARKASEAALQEQLRAMKENNDSLLNETTRLAGVLAKTGARGKWGEAQLERLLEASGLRKGLDYEAQARRLAIGEADQQPDVTVRLPGGGEIFVDSKFPLDDFMRAVETTDDVARDLHLTAHLKAMHGHIKALGKRGYSAAGTSPDFVVLFLPFESLLSTALERDPVLLEQAFRENVILATPTTMLALLRTIAYGWTQESAARNVREIADLTATLFQRMSTLATAMDAVGKRIDQTADAYNKMVGSWQSRTLPITRKIAAHSGREKESEALESVHVIHPDVRALGGALGEIGSGLDDEHNPASEDENPRGD